MTWFAHRRLVRREFLALWAVVVLFCLPFVLLAVRQPSLPTATDWGSGIETLQIPISLLATALLSHLEMVWRLPGPWVVSVLVGEFLLTPTWLS
jgi:hypothetical protein